ncbi:MAG: hypothetical protein ACI86S_000326, partial [Paracoccaceae bacterium]
GFIPIGHLTLRRVSQLFDRHVGEMSLHSSLFLVT